MQKKIIALAIAAAFAVPATVLAAAHGGAAGATLYGSLDAGYASSKAANGDVTTGMSSGTYATNNWGIKGSDDLGDGMKATYQFEAGFNVATGNNTTNGTVTGTAPAGGGAITGGTSTNTLFDRGIAVGISAGWGAVVLGGNQYSTSFKVNKEFDPFGYKYIATTGMAGVAAGSNGRNDSDVAYTGKFGDVTVMAGRTFLSSTAGAAVGNASSVGAVYKSGAITAGASYTSTEKVDAPAAVAKVNYSVGGAFSFGDGSVNVGYISNKAETATDATVTTVLGATYNVSSKIGVGAALYKTATGSVTASNRTMLSGTYALSKKTTTYAFYTSESEASTNAYGLGLAVGF